MKPVIAVVLILTAILSLPGCAGPKKDNRVLVSIEETEGFTVENNGILVYPGEDAVFTITLDYGLSLAGTDYNGKSRMETTRRTTTLTLEDIRYPTRVHLSLTRDYVEITYHANGGTPIHNAEDQITESYSLSNHSRPNTDTGTDLFAREGYTLTCWNTEPDGSGVQVGLGSRVTVSSGSLDLYAQWEKWSDAEDFLYTVGESVTITGYTGSAEQLVIPEWIGGLEVTAIAAGAFRNCKAETILFPKSMDYVESGAFENCSLHTVMLFDNIISIHDDSFVNCENLQTLRINAIEAPFGYLYRKESCYADKVDLLINAQGKQKLVFYGGCSMWYNMDGFLVFRELGRDYAIINMGLNGTVNSAVQMQIIGVLLEKGDIFFHTPELSSRQQMMSQTDMLSTDKSLWIGIENNYDLFTLVNLQTVGGVFDSLCAYLDRKDGRTTYAQYFIDDDGQNYMDILGCVPFARTATKNTLEDNVYLDPERIDEAAMERLKSYYDWYQNKGVRVYVSYACVNMDAVPEEQRGNVALVDAAFRSAIDKMDGPTLISRLEDFLYHNKDFYDTNYHLLTEPARSNTVIWLRDLLAQMEADGLLTEDRS